MNRARGKKCCFTFVDPSQNLFFIGETFIFMYRDQKKLYFSMNWAQGKNCVFYLLSQVKKMLPWVNRVEWKHFFSRLKLFFFLMYRTEWKKISLVKLFFAYFEKNIFTYKAELKKFFFHLLTQVKTYFVTLFQTLNIFLEFPYNPILTYICFPAL